MVTPPGRDSVDSREERDTKDSSGVTEPRDNTAPRVICGGILREPTVADGCPPSEVDMTKGDEYEEITTDNTARSTTGEEMGITITVTKTTRITRGRMDTWGRTTGGANGRTGILSDGTRRTVWDTARRIPGRAIYGHWDLQRQLPIRKERNLGGGTKHQHDIPVE